MLNNNEPGFHSANHHYQQQQQQQREDEVDNKSLRQSTTDGTLRELITTVPRIQVVLDIDQQSELVRTQIVMRNNSNSLVAFKGCSNEPGGYTATPGCGLLAPGERVYVTLQLKQDGFQPGHDHHSDRYNLFTAAYDPRRNDRPLAEFLTSMPTMEGTAQRSILIDWTPQLRNKVDAVARDSEKKRQTIEYKARIKRRTCLAAALFAGLACLYMALCDFCSQTSTVDSYNNNNNNNNNNTTS